MTISIDIISKTAFLAMLRRNTDLRLNMARKTGWPHVVVTDKKEPHLYENTSIYCFDTGRNEQSFICRSDHARQ